MRADSCFFIASLVALAAQAVKTAAVGVHDPSSHVVQFERRDPSSATYPPVLQPPPRSSLPQAWVDALNSLVQQGKIPNIPAASVTQGGAGLAYPAGTDMSKVCSWTLNKCYGTNDIHDTPAGHWTISFDDGPTAASTGLYDYLHQHNQAGSHFMIGSQIVAYKDAALHAAKTNQQLAVHTWSHSLQTTLDNMAILGELGWTMQIIYDLTGRVPNLWRPPQGDIDNRVRAIAEGVFNLTAVMWNAECNDWCIQSDGTAAAGCLNTDPGKDQSSVTAAINKALDQPKSPGVTLLEHELNQYTVGFFENYYPSLTSKGWTPLSVPDSVGMPWYSNAKTNDDTPVNVTSMVYADVKKAMDAANANSNTSQGGSSTSINSQTTSSTTTSPVSSSQSSPSSTNTLISNSPVSNRITSSALPTVISKGQSTFVAIVLAIVMTSFLSLS